MKHVHLFAAALLALAILIGCAGSDDGPATTGTVLNGTPRIEAVVRIQRTNLKNPGQYTDEELKDPTRVNPDDLVVPTLFGVQDPRNIQTGEQYWFQLVRYDENGNRIIINNDVTWTVSDGSFANLGSDSGLFLAGDNLNQTQQFVFAEHGGVRYEAEYNVKPRQVRLIGRVLAEGSNDPVPGIEVFFFDTFGGFAGVARTAYDGTFRASVPTNTASFQPTVASVPNEFFQSFTFQGLRYSIGYPQCNAPIHPLEVGTEELGGPIHLTPREAGQPTPAPTGCAID